MFIELLKLEIILTQINDEIWKFARLLLHFKNSSRTSLNVLGAKNAKTCKIVYLLIHIYNET